MSCLHSPTVQRIIQSLSLFTYLGSVAFGACDATVWTEYKGAKIWRLPESDAYFYVVTRMNIDADGAPNAYHPEDRGLDALVNAGHPDHGWRNVLVADPDDPSVPYRQKSGEYQGYFVSKTSLQNRNLAETDVHCYVNAAAVPYLVFPGKFRLMKGTGDYGDLVMARRLTTGQVTGAIVADGGPQDAPLGEVSIALATRLGGKNVNPRTGAGAPKGPFVYVVFPKSKAQPSWPVSDEDLQARAQKSLAAVGGWDRILACVTAQ
jgi:hypothetical protein